MSRYHPYRFSVYKNTRSGVHHRSWSTLPFDLFKYHVLVCLLGPNTIYNNYTKDSDLNKIKLVNKQWRDAVNDRPILVKWQPILPFFFSSAYVRKSLLQQYLNDTLHLRSKNIHLVYDSSIGSISRWIIQFASYLIEMGLIPSTNESNVLYYIHNILNNIMRACVNYITNVDFKVMCIVDVLAIEKLFNKTKTVHFVCWNAIKQKNITAIDCQLIRRCHSRFGEIVCDDQLNEMKVLERAKEQSGEYVFPVSIETIRLKNK